jgi:hypothetical protein
LRYVSRHPQLGQSGIRFLGEELGHLGKQSGKNDAKGLFRPSTERAIDRESADARVEIAPAEDIAL